MIQRFQSNESWISVNGAQLQNTGQYNKIFVYVGVSKNRGTPKSSSLIGFSIINHPFWGTPILGNTHMLVYMLFD